MPFRTREILEAWLAEFQGLGHPIDGSTRVIEQDGADGADTGLVAVELTSGVRAYLQPDGDKGLWAVTLESREDALELASGEVARLSAELSTIAALCAFLHAKSSHDDA